MAVIPNNGPYNCNTDSFSKLQCMWFLSYERESNGAYYDPWQPATKRNYTSRKQELNSGFIKASTNVVRF